MSYRLVKLTTHYPLYLDDFCRRFPHRDSIGYEAAAAQLHADAFAWADFYARNLRTLGVEAHELVANAEWLQAAWAREHGRSETGDALVLRQLEVLRPDVLFIQDIFRFGGDFIRELRERALGIQLVLGWCCSPYGDAHVSALRACDALLTCTPGFVDEFRTLGRPAFLLNHAFEATLLKTLPSLRDPVADVVFSGHIVRGPGWHDVRGRLLEQLVSGGFDLHVFGKLVEESRGRTRLKQAAWAASRALGAVGLGRMADQVPALAKARTWSGPPDRARFSPALRAAVRPPLFGRTMYRTLQASRVGLNVHIDVARRYAGNMRLFECTGAGTCLLTDWKENLGDLFEIDSEIVAYRSPEECAEKLGWLLAHEAERRVIADRGQARTLRSHTFALRAVQLDDIIRGLLGSTSAPRWTGSVANAGARNRRQAE